MVSEQPSSRCILAAASTFLGVPFSHLSPSKSKTSYKPPPRPSAQADRDMWPSFLPQICSSHAALSPTHKARCVPTSSLSPAHLGHAPPGMGTSLSTSWQQLGHAALLHNDLRVRHFPGEIPSYCCSFLWSALMFGAVIFFLDSIWGLNPLQVQLSVVPGQYQAV